MTRTVTYAGSVPTLADAWRFVMAHLDELGDDPTITIGPVWTYGDETGEDGRRSFEVSVSGTTP